METCRLFFALYLLSIVVFQRDWAAVSETNEFHRAGIAIDRRGTMQALRWQCSRA
jgi:hypothetical protein